MFHCHVWLAECKANVLPQGVGYSSQFNDILNWRTLGSTISLNSHKITATTIVWYQFASNINEPWNHHSSSLASGFPRQKPSISPSANAPGEGLKGCVWRLTLLGPNGDKHGGFDQQKWWCNPCYKQQIGFNRQQMVNQRIVTLSARKIGIYITNQPKLGFNQLKLGFHWQQWWFGGPHRQQMVP